MKMEEFMKNWKQFQEDYFNDKIKISIKDFDFINSMLENTYNILVENLNKGGKQ